MEMRTTISWSNGHFGGQTNGMHECGHHQYVVNMQWQEQDNWGLIDLEFTCSDGKVFGFTNYTGGSWNRALNCSGGFQRLRGREQDNYGIINVCTYCLYDAIEQDSNGNYAGFWDPELSCPSWAPVVVGFEIHWTWFWGIYNFRARCSNGVPGVGAGLITHVLV